jgi:DNA repair exonuclease SbcCD ATPase subunit
MDVQTIDQTYQQLENQSQQTIAALSRLSQKLQGAVGGGDQNAREWQLDLREIALQIQQEQNQVTALLQAIHGFVANQAQQAAAQPQQPVYQPQPQPQYQAPQPSYQQQGGGGGALQNFLGGGFGQAIVRGAGFGIGDDLINHLFR